MQDETSTAGERVSGPVKWYDAAKGFGFITDAAASDDVLLHGNVLRKFGQGSVVEGALVEGTALRGPRGRQFVQVTSITPPRPEGIIPIEEFSGRPGAEVDSLPLWPGRVKWFDKSKGFGFANVFGYDGDVFLHVEVLRHSGLSALATGEAVALRVFRGRRGLMAAQVLPWDSAPSQGPLPVPPEESAR